MSIESDPWFIAFKNFADSVGGVADCAKLTITVVILSNKVTVDFSGIGVSGFAKWWGAELYREGSRR